MTEHPEPWIAEQRRWQTDRAFLRDNRAYLSEVALNLYPDLRHPDGLALLARREWIPDRPIPFADVHTELRDGEDPPLITGREPESSRIRPLTPEGGRFPTYSAAVSRLDPPLVFENRPTYNLSRACLLGDSSMAFTTGTYFDFSDVGAAAAHELAATVCDGSSPGLASLPLRRLISDPTDAHYRPIPVAIVTLTLRHDARRGDVRFLTHWRDPAKVAAFGGLYSVVPVGMFQPAGTPTDDGIGDFDLWRCVAREYSEELLGEKEHSDVDYASWPFFRTLQRLRDEGACRPYCLGIVVDPLTLATDILASTVFDADAFDSVFAGLVRENDEGRVVVSSPDGTFGTRFDHDELERMLTVESVQPAGAAVLKTAWRLRDTLLYL